MGTRTSLGLGSNVDSISIGKMRSEELLIFESVEYKTDKTEGTIHASIQRAT
jgi:hypothetical protein